MQGVTITVFPNLSGTTTDEYTTTFEGLRDWLVGLPEYPNKESCPLISLNRFGQIKTAKGSLRSNQNIQAATGVIGDYDAGEMPPEEAAALFRSLNVAALVVTTPSHGLKGNRWRLLLPFSEEKTPEEKHALIGKANTLLGGVLAGESFTASQAFYVGRVTGVPYSVYAAEGTPLDQMPGVEAIPETGRPRARVSTGEVDEFTLLSKRAEGGVEQVREVLGHVPNEGHDWEYWNKVGMAVFNAAGGSDEGLEAWREWSNRCPGDGDTVEERWEHYQGSPPTELGMGTLVHLAGGLPPAPPAQDAIGDQFGAPKLRGTEAQVRWAATIRAQKLVDCMGDEALIERLCSRSGPSLKAAFWIDNRGLTAEEIAAKLTPVESVQGAEICRAAPELVSGFQFLGVTQQLELFAGCVYIQDLHRIFTPNGALLKSEQFNATYGGYTFQLEEDASGKTTRKAWEAFTESQAIRFPKVRATCFRPDLSPGAVVEKDGQHLVNVYVPVKTPRKQGDPGPFLRHLAKLLPAERDRRILLSYMAACIQYPGVKFQWAPLIQGAEGNGKTLFTRCVAFAIGDRHTHMPPANEISEKFNDWLFFKLFIGIEDVFVPEHKKEVIEILKPMITNERLAMRAMQQSQVMHDNLANFILNSNHKDGWRKTRNDRRISMFLTAQQSTDDIARDGLSGDYFPDLYDWLKGAGEYTEFGPGHGYAIVADYLERYAIPEELNPATRCHRAPDTTTTAEAIDAGMGGIEQEILEAVEEGRPGFAGGWISSLQLDRLLKDMRAGRAIPPNRRRELLQSLGYDWHPALTNGRANNPTIIDAGKPRLFIRAGHISANLTKPAEVVRAYEDAQQRSPGTNEAERAFSK